VVAAPSLLKGGAAPEQAIEWPNLPWLALRPYYRSEVALKHAVTGATERSRSIPVEHRQPLRPAQRRGHGPGRLHRFSLAGAGGSGNRAPGASGAPMAGRLDPHAADLSLRASLSSAAAPIRRNDAGGDSPRNERLSGVKAASGRPKD